MELQITEQRGTSIATLSGSMAPGESEALAETLADHAFHDGARLVIDLSGLKSIDSSGLSALMNVVTRSRTTGGQVVLVNPTGFVKSVFVTTRLDHYFDIASSVDAAVERLGSL